MRFTSILPSALLAATAIAAPSSSTLEARQFAPLRLAAFSGPGCSGESITFPIMPPNVPLPQPFIVQSVSLNRPLVSSERLELRRGFCEELISALGGTSSPGCYPVDHAQCLQFKPF